MSYAELLRATVFLIAGAATVLAAIAIIGAQQPDTSVALPIIGAAWWLAAAWIGLTMGGANDTAESMRGVLSRARSVNSATAPASLSSPNRIALACMWPILAATIVAGGIGIFIPEIAMVGAGYAILVALSWRNREKAVLAIEVRDGVRFMVESGSAIRSVKLIRTPGFTSF